jgi:general secretion pathway protein G
MLTFLSYKNTDNKCSKDGFTVVELLIVIVVIAILAAVSAVAFSNVQNRAIDSSLKQSLAQVIKRVEADKVIRGNYADSLQELKGSTNSNNEDMNYQYTPLDTGYCVSVTMKGRAMYASSSDSTPTQGVCDGHDQPASGPIVDPVVHTQTGTFDTRQPTEGGGVDVSFEIDYDLQPSDYVFILYNAGYRTKMKLTAPNGTTLQPLYNKSMGVSGYQQHIAYGISGLTGRQTIGANACWSVQCHQYSSTVEAGYVVYVVRGLGPNPTFTATSTAYGTNPPEGSQFGPSAQSLGARKLAVFSYTYYGTRSPGFIDKSNPALTWKIDATSGNTSRDQVAARHTYTSSSTEISYAMIIPSGVSARYSGAVLFTFQ